MSPLKKIDYRELGKEASQKQPRQLPQGEAPTAPAEQAQQPAESEKTSFFGSLANKWSLMGKKEKIETFVLVIILCSIIVSLVFYFMNKKPVYKFEGELITDDFMPLEEDFIEF